MSGHQIANAGDRSQRPNKSLARFRHVMTAFAAGGDEGSTSDMEISCEGMRNDLASTQRHETSSKTLRWHSDRPLELESGLTLDAFELAYRTWGTLNSDGDNVVFICHPLTASADADVWWSDMFGDERLFDERRDFIVCANVLGGCYGSTGSVSIDPDGRSFGARFPALTIRDQVLAQMHLADALGVRRVRLLVGASMGGLQALEWSLMDPERVLALIVIAASARHSAWCIGWSEAQRMAIRADTNFADGNYTAQARPSAGLGVARAIAMHTYRDAVSLGRQFGRMQSIEVFGDVARDPADFAMRAWLRHHATNFVARFDANCYLTLLDAMDTHDVGRKRGGLEKALRRCWQPTLVVAISSDLLYRPEEQRLLRDALPASEYFELVSDDGHDGFLTAAAELEPRLRLFSETLRSASSATRLEMTG
jgi:homoserine O-acetyltransferase/O-succinyltransferase